MSNRYQILNLEKYLCLCIVRGNTSNTLYLGRDLSLYYFIGQKVVKKEGFNPLGFII